jgi:membrane-associated protease RseP (regulator of RpoE activity)
LVRVDLRKRSAIVLAIVVSSCVPEAAPDPASSHSVAAPRSWIDDESLAALLEQSVVIDAGASTPSATVVELDGWVVRLAIDPLIAGRSPVVFEPVEDRLRISMIPEGSPWTRAGLRDGDEIQTLGGLAPTEFDGLRKLYAAGPRELTVVYTRGGERRELILHVAEGQLWGRSDAAMAERRAQHLRARAARQLAVEQEREDRRQSFAEAMEAHGGLSRHIRCSGNRCRISQTLIDQYIPMLLSVRPEAEVEYVFAGETLTGLRFTKIEDSGVLSITGIEVGDVLLSLAGQPVSSFLEPDESLINRATEQMIGKRTIDVVFERDGEQRVLEIEPVFASDLDAPPGSALLPGLGGPSPNSIHQSNHR